MWKYLVILPLLVNSVFGHGTMNIPASNRNHDGTKGTARLGCYGHGCYWFQQSCYIGCTKCYNGNTQGTRPASCQKMVNTNKKVANPTYPWGAPGHAPIMDVCGYGGVAIPQGTGTRKGSFLPPKTPVKWQAGFKAEVAWSVYSDHFGGYQYRVCPTDDFQPNTKTTEQMEACFENNVLEFVTNNHEIRPITGGGKGTTIPAVDITTGVKPANKAWRTNPITSGSTYYKTYTNWLIVDEVWTPKWPGTYVLQWRWDCDQTSQVWTNCADITVEPGPAPPPAPVPVPPPAPPPAFNAQAIVMTDVTQKCFDLYGANTTDGNKIEIWDCNGLDNQKWVFAAGTYEIQYAKDTSKCIDLPGGSLDNGNKLQIWTCNGLSNQKWGYDGQNNAIWYAGTTYDPNSTVDAFNATRPLYAKCVDLTGNDTKNGNLLEIWDCNQLTQQKWLVPSAVTMQIAGTSKCLDVPGGDATPGSPIQLWECNGHENQAFLWSTSYAGYQIRYVPDLSKCLDLSGGVDKAGNWLQLWNCNGQPAQQWFGDKDGSIKRQTDDKMCIDLYADDKNDGTRIEIWQCNGLGQQKWTLADWHPYSATGPRSPKTVSQIPPSMKNGSVFV